MRLFLSSENLGKYPDVFLELVGKHKLALIENAKDGYSEQDRRSKIQQHIDQFSSQGFDPEEIDLREYFVKPKELLNKLSNFGGVFVFGGNTFVLRRAMAASGFDRAIKKLFKEDRIAYGGSSAGSMIMTPDLKGPIWSEEDRSDIIPEGYDAKVIWQGLNLVPFYIVPHFGSEIHGDSPQKLANYYKSKNLKHYILEDGQVVVINGDKEEFLK
jgi:dipeptidase E